VNFAFYINKAMAVPKKKTSKSKGAMRDSGKYIRDQNVCFDQSGLMHLAHRASKDVDGNWVYKGRVVVRKKAKKAGTEQ
jgi:ribosomal protein L32